MYYQDDIVNSYLTILEKEIKEKYNNETIKTIYIGGGTPSVLSIDQLKRLFQIIQIFNIDKKIEFTIECNIEDITEEKLRLFYKHGVNRLSFGVESFNKSVLKILNRNTDYNNTKKVISIARNIGFQNINLDLIYAVKDQTLKDLEKDIDLLLKLQVEHISTYSLIIEKNTKLWIRGIKPIDEELDLDMYNLIRSKLKKNGYNHYEISNFAKKGYESKHNLVYWNNLEYYGFGLGASGYVNQIRYTNTRSLNNYISGTNIIEKEKMTKALQMENEMILGLRKLEGVNIKKFEKKYHCKVDEVFDIKDLLKNNKLEIIDDFIRINEKYLYTSNDILIYFLLDQE